MRRTAYDTPIQSSDMEYISGRTPDSRPSKPRKWVYASVHHRIADNEGRVEGQPPRLATTHEDYGPRDSYSVEHDYWRPQ